EKLAKTKKEEQAVLGRLAVINKELRRTKSNLYLAQKKIRLNENQIGTLTAELRDSLKDLKNREWSLRGRLREVYKSSGINYLQLFFTSTSMSDFLNRLYFFGKIINFDADLVQDVRTDVRKARQKRAILQTKTIEIKGLALEITDKKNEISEKAEEKEKAYKSLKQRRVEYEAQVAELEKSSKDLEVLILKKIAARKGTKVYGSGRLSWPLRGRMTSRFGYRRHPIWGGRHFHTGIDMAGKFGTAIKAADSGEVIFAGWWDGYGKAVVIDHGRKTTTVYAHLSRIYKTVGAVVAKGQVIGLTGNTGYSTGPHLHFEVRKNGKPVDPMKFLK
ncbi:murein hydrolase activator EnvC family protein, partial [Candidatus Margulisiibacteriota bacterium]